MLFENLINKIIKLFKKKVPIEKIEDIKVYRSCGCVFCDLDCCDKEMHNSDADIKKD